MNKPTKNDIIARLTIKNIELEDILKEYKEAINYINSRLYSIGAPLNDNIHKYNKKQLKIFFDIANYMKGL